MSTCNCMGQCETCERCICLCKCFKKEWPENDFVFAESFQIGKLVSFLKSMNDRLTALEDYICLHSLPSEFSKRLQMPELEEKDDADSHQNKVDVD